MRILVYDVAAEDGGGLFVLKNFYLDVLKNAPSDIEWIFMTSLDVLQREKNIQVVQFEKIKKSWLHRLAFENLKLPRIIKKINPDLIVSLQNMPVKRCNRRQFVYLHQSLQYCPKKFSFLKKEERRTAIRQRVICGIYKKTLPKSEQIFVQTNWIKEATKNWLKWKEERITVVPVDFNPENAPIKKYEGIHSKVFFYPARAEMYKNHDVVIEACKQLKRENIFDYKVIFTISSADGAYANKIIERANGLPIEFVGTIPYEKIWEYYSKTILLFPSYLETCGLPLIEARAAGAWVLASDMPFSHEALDEYPNKEYFIYDSASDLARKMRTFINGKTYRTVNMLDKQQSPSLMECILERI